MPKSDKRSEKEVNKTTCEKNYAGLRLNEEDNEEVLVLNDARAVTGGYPKGAREPESGQKSCRQHGLTNFRN